MGDMYVKVGVMSLDGRGLRLGRGKWVILRLSSWKSESTFVYCIRSRYGLSLK
jgi:hypothetical protein